MLIASFAASAHCWLAYSLLSTKFPGPFQQSWSPDSQATTCIVVSYTTLLCCWEGRTWFLPSWGRKSFWKEVLPSCMTLHLSLSYLICWSPHSWSLCSSGPVSECTNCSSQFSVICKLVDSAPCCLFQVIDKGVKQGRYQQVSLHHSTCCPLPGRVWPIDHYPLRPIMQLVFKSI